MRELKLGKRGPRLDTRSLRLAKYVSISPPPALDLRSGRKPIRWGMLGNDVEGDCTIAGAAHLIKMWARMSGGRIPSITTREVIAYYLRLTGGVDTGLDLLTVLNAWRRAPLAGVAPLAYTTAELTDLRTAVWLFGGAYLGLALPITAQEEFHAGIPWERTTAAPNSWGGHAVSMLGYTEAYVELVTWGTLQRASWTWMARYCDEAYAALPSDWQGNPAFDMAQLSADLEAL